MVGLGVIGAALLLFGLVEFMGFEPVGTHTGTRARITAIYAYEASGVLDSSRDRHQFGTRQVPAAAVDWAGLPDSLVVSGAWFSGVFAEPYGSIGPARAGDLRGSDPVRINRQGRRSLPAGNYTFVVERYQGSQPVEVLARRTIVISGG